MKKFLLYLLILIVLFILLIWAKVIFSSTTSVENTYKGYIYSDKITPVFNTKILEENTNSQNYTYTNSKGYFVLKRKDLNTINKIIIEYNHNLDTIDLRRGGGAGKQITYLFLNRNSQDTLNMETERNFR